MRLFMHRRIISGIALAAFLFGIALPALTVVQQAMDPTSFATICRVDTGAASDPAAPQTQLKSAHCLMCVGTVSPPPAASTVPVVVATVPDLLLPVDRSSPSVAGDAAVLQPLNPRAPPRA